MASGEMIHAGNNPPRVIKTTGFSTTADDTFGLTGGVGWGVTWNADGDVYWTRRYGANDKYIKFTGFSSTIEDSISFFGSPTSAECISLDEDGNLLAAKQGSGSKLFEQAGFTTTINDSLNVSTVEGSVTGVSKDNAGDFGLIGYSKRKNLKLTGFTTTVADSYSVPGLSTTHDLSFGGDFAVVMETSPDDKLYKLAGKFGSTIVDSLNTDQLNWCADVEAVEWDSSDRLGSAEEAGGTDGLLMGSGWSRVWDGDVDWGEDFVLNDGPSLIISLRVPNEPAP